MEYRRGTPCWMQVNINDLESGTAFFRSALGWEIPPGDPALGGYSVATIGGRAVSGVWPIANGPHPQDDSIDVWLAVDDIEASLARLVSMGANPMDMGDGHVQEVMELGFQAHVIDPFGALTGLWQPKSFTGIEAMGEPGAPCWFDHVSDEPAQAAEFYASAFDLEKVEYGGEYWTLRTPGSGGDAYGFTSSAIPEITDSSATRTAGWLVSIASADLESDVARVTAAGGHAHGSIADMEDTGRFSYVSTPAGTYFGLFTME